MPPKWSPSGALSPPIIPGQTGAASTNATDTFSIPASADAESHDTASVIAATTAATASTFEISHVETNHQARDQEDHHPRLHALSKSIVRKYDLRLIPLIFVAYMVFWLDRSNIALARFNGLERDLNLRDAQFNVSLAVFFAMYILFNIPANLILRKIGGGKFLPGLVVTWGIATTASGFVSDFAGLCFSRAAVGASEAGFLGAALLWLGFFYTNEEIVSRVGILLSSAPLAGSIGGLLAAGLSRIDTPAYKGWPWIFFIEGGVTIIIGIAAFFIMPDTPSNAKFLTLEEKIAAKERMVLLDRQSFARRIAGTSKNSSNADVDKSKETFTPKQQEEQPQIQGLGIPDGNSTDKLQKATWRRAILHPVTLILTTGCFLTIESIYAYNLFMPTLLIEMGYRNVLNPLMTAPPNLVAFIYTIAVTHYSQRTGQVAIPLAASACISVFGYVLLVVGSAVGGVDASGAPVIIAPLQYAGTFLAGSGVSAATPLALSWTCVNAHPHYVRAIALGFMISVGNLATFLASFVYIKTNAPRYTTGHLINVIFNTLLVILTAVAFWWMHRENQRRQKGLRDHRLIVPDGVSAEEYDRQLGWDHPRFRFRI